VSAPSHATRQALGQPPENAELEADKLEVAPGTQRQSVEGWVPTLATDDEIRAALEQAFDYRGDVTITRKDGTKLEGYLFDRVSGTTLSTSFARVIPKDSAERVKLSYADIAALAFSGRDPAAGKSWEAWVKKYWAKKTTGEGEASIQPEALE
jgi:hypothetical protein